MELIVRRVLIGLVCGAASSLFLCLAARNLALRCFGWVIEPNLAM